MTNRLEMLTLKQRELIADKFANDIVDAMDMDTLIQIAYDQLYEYYSNCSTDELEEEVVNHFCGDSEQWESYVEQVTDA